MGEKKIQSFLVDLKSQGKASPDGRYWNEFYKFLKKHKRAGEEDPPVPLILAASYLAPADKHKRLNQQLIWAMNIGILDQTIGYLNQLKEGEWVTSSKSGWETENRYWEDLE